MASVYQYDLDYETAVISLNLTQPPNLTENEPPTTNTTSSSSDQATISSSSSNAQFKIEEMKSSDYLDITQESQIFGIDHSNTPPPHYSKVSEKLRQMTSSNTSVHKLQCNTFCGGRNCKYENPQRWSNNEQNVAFPGLFSHW